MGASKQFKGFKLKKGGRAMRMEEMVWGIRQGNKGIYREKKTIRLPFEVVRELEERAKERGLSLSDLIRFYVERGLKKEKQGVEP
jgi:macrodomain Ter protein organizer (MatP/YcbG family)